MSQLDDLVTEVSVTRRLVSVCAFADRAGRSALIGSAAAPDQPRPATYSYASLAQTVQAAAAGLSWRGPGAQDIVGVAWPYAATFALAMHAVRAAGGVPSPVDAALSAAQTASQLGQSGARMVITAPPLAELALAAVDRSWVRQVFSFSDAPGATRFSDLLGLDMIRPSRGRPDDVSLLPFSLGADGRLRPAPVSHDQLIRQVDRADQLAGITGGDVVLAMPPHGNGLAYAVLLDSALLRGATVVAVPRQDLAAAADAHHGTVALVPSCAEIDIPAFLRAVAIG
jgi:acyl-coenzyme A synthetase/AMP-(fatty) acid ligase